MNVEIGAEAALFPKKEYIYGIFVAVCDMGLLPRERGGRIAGGGSTLTNYRQPQSLNF